MKITKDNYFEHIKRIGFENLPLVLKQSHLVIMTKTGNGEDWKLYHSDKDLKRMIDLAFEKLKEYIESQFKNKKGVDGLDGNHLTPRDVAINLIKPHVLRGDTIELHPANHLSVNESDFAAHIEGEQVIVTMLYGTKISEVFLVQDLIEEIVFEKRESLPPAPDKPRKKREAFNHQQPEFRFLKAILHWHNMLVTKRMVSSFAEEVKNALRDNEVNTSSPVYKEIMELETKLNKLRNEMSDTITVRLSEESRELFKRALKKVTDPLKNKSEKKDGGADYEGEGLAGETEKNTGGRKYASEQSLIEQFLNFHKTEIKKNGLEAYINDIKKALRLNRIKTNSPFYSDIKFIETRLCQKLAVSKGAKIVIQLKDDTVKRMEEALQLIEEQNIARETKTKPFTKNKSLDGITTSESQAAPVNKQEPLPVAPVAPRIVNSEDFANMNFETIGFKGKWLNLIGNPCPGFKIAVSGMPKMGKTYLCIEFADYLSQNHGKVLYVSKEEFMSPTLQLKLKEKKIGNPNLDVSGSIPSDLSAYLFIFLDSVSKLKLKTDDLIKLEEANPGKSFVYVFHVTKDGKARGTNEFMHNVDCIIEVPERGKAIQYGRFNQGGEMNIFDTQEAVVPTGDTIHEGSTELSGVNKKSTNKAQTLDWTEPKHLSSAEHFALKKIKELHAKGDFREALHFASNLDTIVREEIPPRIWLEIGGTLTKTGWEKLRKSKKGDSRDNNGLLEKMKLSIKKLEKVNAFIYKTKDADWGDVATLALMHAILGERLNDGYEGARGYSKNLPEGLDRHYKANSRLLKELLAKITEYAKKDYYEEMTDWNSFLDEEVDRFRFYFKRMEAQNMNGMEDEHLDGIPN